MDSKEDCQDDRKVLILHQYHENADCDDTFSSPPSMTRLISVSNLDFVANADFLRNVQFYPVYINPYFSFLIFNLL